MSDATSGFKSARTQSGRQSKDYERATHLRMGRRPSLEPVGAGIGWDVRDCSVLFSTDGLKRSPRAPALRSGPSVVAFGRRVCRDTTSMQRSHNRRPSSYRTIEPSLRVCPLSSDSCKQIFCLNSGEPLYKRGNPATPKAAESGVSLSMRQAEPELHSGGRAYPRPPASQHDAVCGGGAAPTHTAHSCEAGSGGGLDA